MVIIDAINVIKDQLRNHQITNNELSFVMSLVNDEKEKIH